MASTPRAVVSATTPRGQPQILPPAVQCAAAARQSVFRTYHAWQVTRAPWQSSSLAGGTVASPGLVRPFRNQRGVVQNSAPKKYANACFFGPRVSVCAGAMIILCSMNLLRRWRSWRSLLEDVAQNFVCCVDINGHLHAARRSFIASLCISQLCGHCIASHRQS